MSDTKELRGQCPANLAAALDAMALAKGLDRNTFVNQILESHVKTVLREVTLITRTLRGNPLLSDSGWSPLE